MSGEVNPTIGCWWGTSYNPRATRRIDFAVIMRESALSTVGRVPRSKKSEAENTNSFPLFFIRASIARSMGFDTFIENLLSEICISLSDKRRAAFGMDKAKINQTTDTPDFSLGYSLYPFLYPARSKRGPKRARVALKNWKSFWAGHCRTMISKSVHYNELILSLACLPFHHARFYGWCIRQDLNLQPSDPKSEALSN